MYNKILIGTALNHRFKDRALETAKSLISSNGKIIAVHVIEPVNNVVESFVSEEVKAKAHEKIKSDLAAHYNDDAVESVILHGHAGRQITHYAEKMGVDCIIIGSHRPGLEDFFLGSTSSRVVRHSTCSVHVLR